MATEMNRLLSLQPSTEVSRDGAVPGGPVQSLQKRKTLCPGKSRWTPWGRWMFRHRSWLFTPLGGILCLQGLERFWQGTRCPEEGLLVECLGAFGLLAMGLAIRLHVAGRAWPGTSSRGVTFEAGQLITTGLYAYLRNPLYLANLMIWAGLALLVGPVGWAMLLVGLAGFFYHCIVLAEEEYLACRYGPRYAEYCLQVPRWMPKLGRACRAGRKKLPLESPPDGRLIYGTVSLPEAFVSSTSQTVGSTSLPSSDRPFGRSMPNAAPASFTWRRALFREADTVMLVLLAGWVFTFLNWGRLPWQPPQAIFGAMEQWFPLGAASGWAWIKWRKKRSWRHKPKTTPYDAPP